MSWRSESACGKDVPAERVYEFAQELHERKLLLKLRADEESFASSQGDASCIAQSFIFCTKSLCWLSSCEQAIRPSVAPVSCPSLGAAHSIAGGALETNLF